MASSGANVPPSHPLPFPFQSPLPPPPPSLPSQPSLTNPPLQVLRYSALATGIVYGIYHQSAILAKTKTDQIDKEYQQKSGLIQKAKAEWVKKTMPRESKTEGGGVITDPMDSKFDLEAYLTMKAADEAR
ncbi:hypothetical protein N7G274_009590 [Stereocaulon virgatum]|uniref:ATP synthase F(0) complex subunit e, mitochondrial n=1 Tax=Stereocaulon virgatum TaxID=373712 RepID=A0ABR3ZWW0_9LECA